MNRVTAMQGDTWDKISYEQYGSEFYVTELMLANENYVDTLVFSGGEILNIPDVSKDTQESLPPWRR